MSAYRWAIDETARLIERRASSYRNLVVAVVTLGAASIAAALWARNWWPWPCVLLVVPVCGFFYHHDARLVSRWRSELLARWTTGEMDLSALVDALRASPTLPKDTLGAMLGTLPVAGSARGEHDVSRSSRSAVAAVVTAIHAAQTDVIALRTAASALTAVAGIAAVVLGTWYPLSFAAVACLPLALAARVKRLRLGGAIAAVRIAQAAADFRQVEVEGLLSTLEWRPVSSAERTRVMAALGVSSRAAPPSRSPGSR